MMYGLARYIVIYARFSTDEQRNSLSIEGQVSECRAFIAKQWPNEQHSIVVLVDEACSGKLMKRRGSFNDLMARVTAGEVDRVVIEKYERLGRGGPLTEIEVRRIESHGVKVYSTHTEENSGRFIRGLLGLVAEKRLSDDADNTLRGMRELARRGFPPGGPVPYGWRPTKIDDPLGKREQDGRLVQRTVYQIVAEEATVVRRIFKLYDEGWGIGRIARLLNSEHIPPPQGGSEGWDPGTIRAILRNIKYKGYLRFDMRHFHLTEQETRVYKLNPVEQWVEGPSDYIPAIVDPSLWDRIDAAFEARRGTCRRGPTPKYVLPDFVTCAVCGKPCQVSSRSRTKAKKEYCYKYLRCGRAFRRGPTVCKNRGKIAHDPALQSLIAGLERGLFTEANVSYLTDRVRRILQETFVSGNDDVSMLRNALADVERKIGKLVEFIEEHGSNDPDVSLRLKERRAERDRLQLRLADHERGAGRLNPNIDVEAKVRSLIGKTLEMLAEGTIEIFKQELKRHVQSAELFEDGSIRVVGTLEGLLQGTTLQCKLVAGGGFEPPTSGL